MELLLSQILEVFDVVYILTCNAATYFLITFAESFNGSYTMKTWQKRLISATVALLLGLAFLFLFHHDPEALIMGFFVQFIVYDYLLKPIIKKLQGVFGGNGDDVDLDGTNRH